MTQEERQLLLRDLCARLPYGIKFPYHMNGDNSHKECNCIATIDGINDDIVEFTYEENGVTRDWSCPISEVKPYLRSMGSMTEEEYQEFGYDVLRYTPREFDWLNAHHFDYRGMIEKGLALEASADMYKTE